MIARFNAAVAAALAGGRPLTRPEISQVLAKSGIRAEGQRLAYLIMAAELDGLITSGPRRGKEFTHALVEERAPAARRLDRTDALRELTLRFFRSHVGYLDERDLAAVDDDFTNFGIRRSGGRAAVRHIITAWRTAFPDLSVEIQEEIVHEDKLVHRVLMRGTHLGEFQLGIGPGRVMGTMPPTGRTFPADQIHIYGVRDGKVVEHSASRNDLLMLAQLRLLPGVEPVTEQAWREQAVPASVRTT